MKNLTILSVFKSVLSFGLIRKKIDLRKSILLKTTISDVLRIVFTKRFISEFEFVEQNFVIKF